MFTHNFFGDKAITTDYSYRIRWLTAAGSPMAVFQATSQSSSSIRRYPDGRHLVSTSKLHIRTIAPRNPILCGCQLSRAQDQGHKSGGMLLRKDTVLSASILIKTAHTIGISTTSADPRVLKHYLAPHSLSELRLTPVSKKFHRMGISWRDGNLAGATMLTLSTSSLSW
jgi:hypothetical protein